MLTLLVRVLYEVYEVDIPTAYRVLYISEKENMQQVHLPITNDLKNSGPISSSKLS